MAVTRAQKVEKLKELQEKMKNASSIIFAHYIGMTVADVTTLRSDLKKAGSEMKVAKKNLMYLATKECGLPDIEESMLPGAVSIIFSYEDPLSGARTAYEFGKKHEQVKLLGGIFEGKVLSQKAAVTLATIPSRPQLLGIFAGMLQSPMSAFARAAKEIGEKGGVAAMMAAKATPSA